MLKKFIIFFMFTVGLVAISGAIKIRFFTPEEYTVISTYHYQKVVQQAEKDIHYLIDQLKPYQNQPDYIARLVTLSTQYFISRPYQMVGIEGEGDWCPGYITRHGCPHIQQNPVYRTDAFVCNTFVQTVLALLHTNNIQDFNQNILTIRYGAAQEPPSSVHYYNRNNFISADFNPVNQKNGLIQDVTGQGIFAAYVKQTSAIIDRQSWFRHQMQPETLKNTVRVLSAKEGENMVERAQRNYPLPLHHFSKEKVTIHYIPKEIFVQKISSRAGHAVYRANEKIINQLPAPSIIEIVKDVGKWEINGKNITEVIGSGINVSHLGLIYHQYFQPGELIYRNINCTMKGKERVCQVIPVVCRQLEGCHKMMFAHATQAYPNNYYYYRDSRGRYHCDEKAPPGITSLMKCNRVVSMPLGDYLTTYHYNQYAYLAEPSILGIHVEKIMNSAPKKNFS